MMHGNFRAIEVAEPRRLKPLQPNQGIQAAYRKKLEKLIRDMHRSVLYWLRAQYRATPPKMAMDDRHTPAGALARALRELTSRWLKNFDEGALRLARYFAKSVHARTDASLKKILRDAGFSVKFQISPAIEDILEATVEQNVSLIKSIPQQYLKNVEGDVMRSVQAGRDMGGLAKALQKNYGVTKRRAAFIARSQNNLASGAIHRARQIEFGLEAIWRHSGAGKHPRASHVKNNGKKYDPKKGWLDPEVKRYIFPGELPNCRCVSLAVVPGFDVSVSATTKKKLARPLGQWQ
jgi:uncharacterized protein with gpF-like domain